MFFGRIPAFTDLGASIQVEQDPPISNRSAFEKPDVGLVLARG